MHKMIFIHISKGHESITFMWCTHYAKEKMFEIPFFISRTIACFQFCPIKNVVFDIINHLP